MLGAAFKSIMRNTLEQYAPNILATRHLRRYGRDEIEVLLLDLIVSHDRVAIDVGANWGVYARALSALCTRVHCLEPNPSLASILRRTLPANCIVEEAAASDGRGDGTLFMPLDRGRIVDGLASLRPLEAASVETIRVTTKPLDDFIGESIGFVKIDVEGAEMTALAGAEKLIMAHRPVILIEIEERHRAGAIEHARGWFGERGYDGWFIFAGRINPLASFAAETMQNAALFDSRAPRRSQAYVNNFLFAPTGHVDAGMREAIRRRLKQEN